MRNILFTIVASSLLYFLAINAFAQNPKNTKKYKKHVKEKKGEPYTPVYKHKDSDGDGVPDERDECIHTPKGEPVTPFGCPYDVDFDGVFDYEDQCKDVKGPKENKGCPWGDKDNDGILDNVDYCPEVAGIQRFHGCPDTDGDGIQDKDDRCPKEPGLPHLQGCPEILKDTDGDGIDDYHDLCIKVPGVKENKGCPAIKKEDQAALKTAFDNLLFEVDKDIIKESSFPSLDGLAKVLRNNPKYKLHLEGHTDSDGDDEHNLDLSKRRAAAVKKYLVNKGVAEYRITYEGYGETRPVDTNATPEGKKRNRRVEMNIIPE